MSVAIMLRRQTEDQSQHDEGDRALFLSGENKHFEPVAQTHTA